MLVIGIDEAGYGPLLGPLVVAGAAFRLPCEAVGVDPVEALRERLTPLAGRARRGRGDALVIGDSKAVFDRARGLGSLELPLLAFATAARGSVPDTLDTLLESAGVDLGERREASWYAEEPGRFPTTRERIEVEERAARLRDGLAAAEVAFLGFAADVVPEARLNRLLDASGNKGETLFDVSAGVLERLLALREPGEAVHAVLDRQGGRTHYLEPIHRRWPARFAWALDESRAVSRYRLDMGGPTTLEFLVRGDDRAPQVGLASMLAKYLREMYMGLWNTWFGRLCPDVRPTAGYTQDGRRWLAETRSARAAAGIEDATLVRVR